ncbi:hypothetical protein E2562_038034 [Oryza meyeriana var. granulata]|uniref:NAD-dependent epimerase/dehydratase domain-containing protein n=1 Tax=Oryza meyeriana var. granulata TaxID=110450 RepID=A0A6G1CKE3_9ORYZ|nr:hypothetical protein E2562_038034 [Oryza meyeriana var. granulata]
MGVEKATANGGGGAASGEGRTVCVTGAGGFIASWLVKLLLENGYTVRGTVRNSDDAAKNAHLRALAGAAERLALVRAELLDKESLAAAFAGCEGVFHTASPITDDPEKMIEPAMSGARNVITEAADVGSVRRVVMTSSIGAVYMDPRRGAGEEVDETCWSDLDHCRDTGNWYCYAKTVAEQAAWELAKERRLDLVVVNPSLVLGPLLQPAAPVARGRYLCAGRTLHRGEVCRILGGLFPGYPVPTRCKGDAGETAEGCRFSSRKLAELGVAVTPASQCLYDTVVSLQDNGLLPFVPAAGMP